MRSGRANFPFSSSQIYLSLTIIPVRGTSEKGAEATQTAHIRFPWLAGILHFSLLLGTTSPTEEQLCDPFCVILSLEAAVLPG